MKPDISEFSYGYALTDELIHWHGMAITAAPVFPSLIQEGQPGGGYDLKLDQGGVPMFLQFKLADRMVRGTAQEVKDGRFVCPFYRMHLRPARHSNQHEMLVELEARGADVYYSAPAFHRPDELNDAYLTRQVLQRSLWIKPSTIGPLPDPLDHHVAFQVPGPIVVYSEPKDINALADFKTFSEEMMAKVEQRGGIALSEGALNELAANMEVIGERRQEIPSEERARTRDALSNRRPIERIAVYASMFFGAQLFVVRRRQP